ncbi:vesicle transport protein [Catenaria anguillulae PL171]|uniref:Vesicle transport protein n=1 Tax=Catenaria anguillulae PL171 TaxID=765915 RepID=A0A1Y2HYQ9_9FUNG|nr:vesicle transport protein [Catenaria anguillulae PL171]
MSSAWLSDSQKIGVGLTAFGSLFLLLGVLLFFDGGLLAIGNVLFLGGVTMLIGLSKTFAFFARKNKLRGTLCFFAGILLVFMRWPIIGMMIEVFGFINLFGDFFPVVIAFLRRIPVIGPLLSAPGVTHLVDRLAGTRYPV